MLQNAYLLAKIGSDTAEDERNFAEILPKISPKRARGADGAPRAAPRQAERAPGQGRRGAGGGGRLAGAARGSGFEKRCKAIMDSKNGAKECIVSISARAFQRILPCKSWLRYSR